MKKLNYLLLLFLLTFALFTSCQADDEQTEFNAPKQSGITSKTILFDEFKLNTKALDKLKQLSQRNLKKTIYDSSGFYYNEDAVLRLTYQNYTTYTFPIYRSTKSSYLENLVIRQRTSGEIDSYIFKYDLTQQELGALRNTRINNLEGRFGVKSNNGPEVGDYFIVINGKCYTYHSSFQPTGEGGQGELIERECPEGYGEMSVTEDPGSGGFGDTGGFPINIVIAYPPAIPDGPILNPGTGGNGTPIFQPDPVVTSPVVNIFAQQFDAEIKLNHPDIDNYLEREFVFKMQINGLLSGPMQGSDTRKELAYKIIEFAMENDDNLGTAIQILIFLKEEDKSEESILFVEKVLNAINEYKEQYDNPDEELISEFIDDVLNPTELEEEEGEDLGPSCESFNFVSTGSNWQESAVVNIHFNVVLISPQGINVSQPINYPQPILFGCPKVLTIGNTQVTPGIAATVSAEVLRSSMDETVHKYGNKPITETMVRIYFESRLKGNYNNSLPGARVNFNATSFNVTPTEYQTEFLGTGDCD